MVSDQKYTVELTGDEVKFLAGFKVFSDSIRKAFSDAQPVQPSALEAVNPPQFLVQEHNVAYSIEIDDVVATMDKAQTYALAHEMLDSVIGDDWLSGAPTLAENTRPTQPSALERLEAWLWKDIENNHVALEGGDVSNYVCFLIVDSGSGLEPATKKGDTLAAAINAALDAAEGE